MLSTSLFGHLATLAFLRAATATVPELQCFPSVGENGTDWTPGFEIRRIENTINVGSGSSPGAESDDDVLRGPFNAEEFKSATKAFQGHLKNRDGGVVTRDFEICNSHSLRRGPKVYSEGECPRRIQLNWESI